MKNQRHLPFKFGFLNNAQDSLDISDNEALTADSIDADKLALGSLQGSSYITGSEAVKTYDEVEIGGTTLGLATDPGRVTYLDSTSTARHIFDNILDPGLIAVEKRQNGAVSFNGVANVTNGGNIVTVGGIMETALDVFYHYAGVDQNVFTIISDGTGANFSWTSIGGASAGAIPVSVGIWHRLQPNNLNAGASESILMRFVSAVPANTTYIVSLEVEDIPSGRYEYSFKSKYALTSEGGSVVQTPLSNPVVVDIDNIEGTGRRAASYAAFITGITPSALTGGQTVNHDVYRKSPNENEVVKVIDNIVAYPTRDVSTVSELSTVDIADILDESEGAFNTAILNVSNNYVKLFTFENSLWRIPTERRDIIAYSPPGEWWRIQRNNTFKVTGEVLDIIGIKDVGAIDAPLTKVVLTTDGIYHINGSGIETDPYKFNKVISDINIEPNSVVNANGTLMFMSKSTDAGYDTGAYGQKVYEYDLTKLVEVSARVKNSDVITSSNAIEFAELRGGDKYFVKKSTDDNALLYHRDAQNWVEVQDALETNSEWQWISKWYTPISGKYIKFGSRSNNPSFAGARFININYVGDIDVSMQYMADDMITLSTVDLVLPTKASRGNFYTRLPNISSAIWRFNITGNSGSPNPVLFDMDFVN